MKTRNKIKVCHVLTDSAVGGAGRAVAELISATDRERFAPGKRISAGPSTILAYPGTRVKKTGNFFKKIHKQNGKGLDKSPAAVLC